MSRLAAHIAGHEFHEVCNKNHLMVRVVKATSQYLVHLHYICTTNQVELGREDGLPEWRQSMKSILKKTAQSLSHHVLFLYDAQLQGDERYLEDVNNILLSGEVPNLYSVDERQEIVESMRSLEKQLDKSLHTDGSGPALFALFIRRVRENMHVVLAMSPFGEAFKRYVESRVCVNIRSKITAHNCRSISRFPGLLDRCTINWVHQWPDDALNFVSRKFLQGVHFDKDCQDLGKVEVEDGETEKEEEEDNDAQRSACVQLCEHFHNSTINLSKVSRQ